jgi:hypothetical protein
MKWQHSYKENLCITEFFDIFFINPKGRIPWVYPWMNGNSPEGRRAWLEMWKGAMGLPMGFPYFLKRREKMQEMLQDVLPMLLIKFFSKRHII